jgi:hypothetical protein
VLDCVLRVERQDRETLEQRRDGDLCLGAGERCAQAVMSAAAKGKMCGVGPPDEPASGVTQIPEPRISRSVSADAAQSPAF